MQHKPSEPTHKLLCWQSQGEEDITLCRVDTKKMNSDVEGYLRILLLPKLGSQNWRAGSQRAAKAAASPRLALPCNPGLGWGRAPATRLHAGACQPKGETLCLACRLEKDPRNHHHTAVRGELPL